nr:hypothetical protein CFP56_20653 [Quercus suber]
MTAGQPSRWSAAAVGSSEMDRQRSAIGASLRISSSGDGGHAREKERLSKVKGSDDGRQQKRRLDRKLVPAGGDDGQSDPASRLLASGSEQLLDCTGLYCTGLHRP